MESKDICKDFPQSRGRGDPVFAAMLSEQESAMRLYRKGRIPLPQSYIRVHEDFARADLRRVERAGWRVWGPRLVDDGWCDGMMFLAAVVESPSGGLLKIKWSDSGLWYRATESGAWMLCGQPAHPDYNVRAV